MAAADPAYGLLHQRPVYDYSSRVPKGLATALEIPGRFLIGIYLAVNGLTASGLLPVFAYHLLAPLLDFLAVRFAAPAADAAARGLRQRLLTSCRTSSKRSAWTPTSAAAACVMAGGCETVIYVLALSFSVTGVTPASCFFCLRYAGIPRRHRLLWSSDLSEADHFSRKGVLMLRAVSAKSEDCYARMALPMTPLRELLLLSIFETITARYFTIITKSRDFKPFPALFCLF